MNIVLVSPYDFATPGGVTEHVTQLDRALRFAGHSTTIIAPRSIRPGFTPPDHLISAGQVISVPTNGSVARISLSLGLGGVVKRVLADIQPDIVHVHEPFMPLLPFFVLRQSFATNVATFHAYSGNELGYHYGRGLIEHYFSRIDGRIAVSPAARSFISRHFPGNYTVIPNGVDVERFQNAEPFSELRDGYLNLLFVGRLDERKGFNILLRAFAQLRRRRSAIRLIVVGAYDAGQAARHKARLAGAGVPDVLFVGYATPRELARYYASCDIVCAPSLGGESFGIVLLEGMAAGKPIVASRIPGYRDVVDDGVDGLLVQPGDVHALDVALDAMIGDREWREALGRRGRSKAWEYSWDLIADRVAGYYEDTLGHRRLVRNQVGSADSPTELTTAAASRIADR